MFKFFRLIFLFLLIGLIPISFAQKPSVSGGEDYSLLLCQTGKVMVWGNGDKAQTGTDILGQPNGGSNLPISLMNLPDLVVFDAGFGQHALGLTCDGRVYAWGDNSFEQLGNCSLSDDVSAEGTFVQSLDGTGFLSEVVDIAAGDAASFALLADSTVVSWGSNGDQQNELTGSNTGVLGINISDLNYKSCLPQLVIDTSGQPIRNIIAIQAGESNAFALTADGKVYSWGDTDNNTLGRFGTGEVANFVLNENDQAIEDIIAIAAGGRHCLALKANGNLYAWGGDWGPGQIGDGPNYYNGEHATKVLGGESDEDYLGDNDPVVSIAAGVSHSIASTETGLVYTWGGLPSGVTDNSQEQFGMLGAGGISSNGCLINSFIGSGSYNGNNTLPVLAKTSNMQPLTNIAHVSAGYTWSFVVTKQNKLYVAGYGPNGELGTGNTIECFFTELALPNCSPSYHCPQVELLSQKLCLQDSTKLYGGEIPPGFKATWTLPNGEQIVQENPFAIDGSGGLIDIALNIDNITRTDTGEYQLEIEDLRLPTQRTCEPCQSINARASLKLHSLPYTNSDDTYFCGNDIYTKVDGVSTGIYEWYPTMESTQLLGTTLGVDDELYLDINEIDEVYGEEPNRHIRLYLEDVSTIDSVIMSNQEIIDNEWQPNNTQGSVTRLNIKVTKEFILNSIDVIYFGFRPTTDSSYISIYTAEDELITQSKAPQDVSTFGFYKTTLNINTTLPVGEYYIEGEGIVLSSSDGYSPLGVYNVENYEILELTSPREFVNQYPSFVNWNISVGETLPCLRTPVEINEDCPPIVSNEKTTELSVFVTPNPFTHEILVSSKKVIRGIKLLDEQGRTIISTNDSKINASSLPNGVYYVHVTTMSGKTIRKIVKN